MLAIGHLKNSDNTIAASESIFVLMILEKNIKEINLKLSQGSVTVL